MRVGILGSGLMGGKLGTLFARAGHEVVFSYSHSEEKLKKLAKDYDPTNKMHALTALHEADQKGEVLTGVLYVDTGKPTFLDMLNMADEPLATLPENKTRPSKEALDQIMEELR